MREPARCPQRMFLLRVVAKTSGSSLHSTAAGWRRVEDRLGEPERREATKAAPAGECSTVPAPDSPVSPVSRSQCAISSVPTTHVFIARCRQNIGLFVALRRRGMTLGERRDTVRDTSRHVEVP
ncbi:hypothetical protein FRC12_022283 [Ceratobasidium sp. 428]|nr:hypothetical protein FRC12_022283 [Ceratobasidium sp. 428]